MARPRSRAVQVTPEVFDLEEARRMRAELEDRLDHIRAVIQAKRQRAQPASPPWSNSE